MLTCPRNALGQSTCAQFIAQQAQQGQSVEVDVTTDPPPVGSPYGVNSFICPHDVEYFIHPSRHQVVEWTRNQVP